MSIPVALSMMAGEKPAAPPGTFRKMLLIDPPAEHHQAPTNHPAVVWKTPERESSQQPPVVVVEAPGAPKRPRYPIIAAAKQHSSPLLLPLPIAAVVPPSAASPPEQHPSSIPAAAALTTPPVQEQQSHGDDYDDGGREGGHAAAAKPLAAPTAMEALLAAASRAERCIAPDIPKRKRARYNRLLEYLRSPDRGRRPPISPSDHGELVTDKLVRGTNYADVLRALFLDSRYEVAGLCEAVGALHKAGAPADLLGSRRAIDLFNLGGHTLAQEGGADGTSHRRLSALKLEQRPPPPPLPGRAPNILRVYD